MIITRERINLLCYILILCLLLPHHGFGKDRTGKNISVQTDGTIIDIRYDFLPDRRNRKHTVYLEISDNGGLTYDVTPRIITGDIGRDVVPGRNKRILWFIERDFPGDIDLDRYDFRISAKPQGFSRNLLYVIVGAVVAGGGTAAYFIFSGDDEGFPQPPGRPD
jgi:hypothetical protein